MLGFNFENSYTTLPSMFYTRKRPRFFHDGKLACFNDSLAKELGLDASALDTDAKILYGYVPDGLEPIAQAYSGHQFGSFNKLGDGRAVLLGEHITPNHERYDIQLKGSGLTPYSRNGDGLAALSPMLREYIISEAMHYLGVPTTRSLAVASTGEKVHRQETSQAAVLTRVAKSHIRVGSFSHAATFGSSDDVRKLADYSINRHFPTADNYIEFFRQVCLRQAELIAKWQLLGFVHGVMNTDNMLISGETIDYGPCAFLDEYNPNKVFSSIDYSGRYSYSNQPQIGAWNLLVLAESLLVLMSDDKTEELSQIIREYFEHYNSSWLSGIRPKLGITTDHLDDINLILEFFKIMSEYRLDYTHTLYALSQDMLPKEELASWHHKWSKRIALENAPLEIMKASNPATIPRNAYVEDALSAATHGDFTLFNSLLSAVRQPYSASEYTEPKTSPDGYKTFCGT